MKRVFAISAPVLGALVADLIAAHLVEGSAQVLDEVELFEHQHRLAGASLDGVDVGLPHVTADALQLRRALGTEEVKERS